MHIIIRLAPERPIETPFEFVSYIPSSSKRTPEPVYNDQLYHRQLLLNEVEVDKTGNDKKMNPIQVPIRDSISRKSSKLGPIFRGPYKAVNVPRKYINFSEWKVATGVGEQGENFFIHREQRNNAILLAR